MAKKKDECDAAPVAVAAPVAAAAPVEVPEPEPLPSPDETPLYDHTAVYGSDSIVSEERGYFLWQGGRRHVHVGDTPDGRWVYRPD